MKWLLFSIACVLASSCSLSRAPVQSAAAEYRAQSISDYRAESASLSGGEAERQLVVLPFNISLQRHYLVKDPVFERSRYLRISRSLAKTIESWSERRGYDSEILDIADRGNLFASQRITSTSIRLLNKKSSITQVPPLTALVRDLDTAKEAAGSLIMAGSYIGHNKSGGQLLKERVSSSMRYVSSLGRRQLRRPVSGFGKLFVVVLESDTGRVVWFNDAEASPDSVDQAMTAVLSQFEQADVEQAARAEQLEVGQSQLQ